MEKEILGIDIAKDELVIFYSGSYTSIQNNQKSITSWFKKKIKDTSKIFVVFEPTGGYEKGLRGYLQKNNMAHRMVHANHVRAYAKALGILAKTDAIDARILADYASAVSLKPSSINNQHAQLKALLNRRDQLIDMRIEENNRLETADDKQIIKMVKQHIKYINNQLSKIEAALKQHVKLNDKFNKQFELYTSIPGIGWITALRVIVDLPEIDTYTEKQIAALTGLAPMNKDSGTNKGRRYIMAGRPKVRRALYMATIAAIKFNPLIKTFYRKLKANGKPGKVAIIACARKLLILMMSIAKRQTPWVNVMT